MTSDEDKLIAEIRAGGEQALVQLIEIHRRELLASIERRMGDALRRKIDCEDILQETVTYCLSAFPNLDRAALEPLPWLYRIAERRVIDAHRRYFGAQKRSGQLEVPLGNPASDSRPALIDLLISSITTPSQKFARGQREARLLEAMEQLSAEQRDVLRMRYVDAMPSKEIARRVSKTDGAVRVMLTRALKQLHELLESRPLE